MGSLATTATPQRVPEIPSELESVGKFMSSLHESIERLERRLEFVARPIGPKTTEDAQPTHQVPMVDRLSNLCAAIRHALNRVDDLYDRLEV